MPFIPHTENDIQEMLSVIGVNSIEHLFEEIPQHLRAKRLEAIPEGLSEMEMAQFLKQHAEKDNAGSCFIGAGAYEHHIPAAVWDITSRGEFMTAYTPYQAEASQGTLQLLYEYQSMMAHLTGMEVSNASLYDGASALAEAVLMAVRLQKHTKSRRILMPATVHPMYRRVVKTIVQHQGIECVEIPYLTQGGHLDLSDLQQYKKDDFVALIISQPNFFGVLEDIDVLTDWAHQQGAFVIASVNPTSLGILKEPGHWGSKGADIVCGEGQPLGVPLASGGPYFGFMCCRQEYVRQMPGRIIGCTVDSEGKRGFALTLQAREQHIRRSKATSNICTNQGLLVTAATIYLSLMGAEGLKRIASVSHANTQQLIDLLSTIPGVSTAFNRPFFHETVIRVKQPVNEILSSLAAVNIQGGYPLQHDYPELKDCLLICATETKTVDDLKNYKEQLAKLV